ncbi:TATA-box-binding protein-like [Sorghum bicolor]|uniref:TATA-box-binding protein-like n=1 Tax=Sorghum bicolor TaxID=4558 RepID=UPI000B424018|nr:TATA-box-binding protein-like [Sorghum bicolor]|eukprot:XP_021303789.1 TATA-box-binding protein-like [Sorghum bicolor]
MAKRLKAGAASKEPGSSDSQPPADAGSALSRPEPTLMSSTRVEAPQTQGREGAPEPSRLGVEADPITISDTSGALEEQKDKEKEGEEREREATRPPQEQQQQQQHQQEEQQQQQEQQTLEG